MSPKLPPFFSLLSLSSLLSLESLFLPKKFTPVLLTYQPCKLTFKEAPQ